MLTIHSSFNVRINTCVKIKIVYGTNRIIGPTEPCDVNIYIRWWDRDTKLPEKLIPKWSVPCKQAMV